MVKNSFFPEINGNFGFGFMRLPMNGDEVDITETCKMVDAYISAGFNYFDTAHVYINGKSETALRECVVKRYDRSEIVIANKLSSRIFEKTEDIRPLFEDQLRACGTDYFDFYLMHAQDRTIYERYQRLHAYETAYEFKKEGRVRHFGISFHDKADVLEKILTEHPEIEVVQIQFNYADYDDPSVESRAVYETCVRHGRGVLVMEPVKGGHLVRLPEEADAVFRALGGGSNASYAIRYAASFPGVCAVLSGMGTLEQVEENVSFMRDFRPLDERELEAVDRVRAIFAAQGLIPCTACRYCVFENKCPADIPIPELFAAMNTYSLFKSWNTKYYYSNILTPGRGKASQCVQCGGCEGVCPQHLEIRQLLKKTAETFETSED